MTQVFGKSSTEPKSNLLKSKNIVSITTFNVRALNTINKLSVLIAPVAEDDIVIVCN